MMATTLGVTKSPVPSPTRPSSKAAMSSGASGATEKAQLISPSVHKSMPALARAAGERWSESRPAIGETTNCSKGWMSRRKPASRGDRPRAYCR